MKKIVILLTTVILAFSSTPAKVRAREVTEGDRRISSAYHERGVVKCVDDDYAGAIEDFTSAIEFNPEVADSYVGRGLAYMKTGNKGSAKTDFDKAISMRPGLEKVLRPLLEASPWVLFGEDETTKMDINLDSIKVSDGILSFLFRQVNVGGTLEGWTEFFNAEINCNEPMQERTVNYYTKSPDSLEVKEDEWPGYWIRVWNPIKSGSNNIYDYMAKKYCKTNNWWFAGEGGKAKFYIDTNSIERSGDILFMVWKEDGPNGIFLEKMQFNCQTKQYKNDQYQRPDWAFWEDYDDQDWKDIVNSDSAVGRAVEKYCH